MAPLLAAGQKMSRREYEQWLDAHTWDPARETELVVQDDLSAAAWLEPLLVPDSWQVRMTAPQGFESYARIFFPFSGEDILQDGVVGDWEEGVTWTELARRNGRTAHPLMEQETISDGQGACGSELADEQLTALLPILASHTSSTSGWFLLWDGFGDLNERVFSSRRARVKHSSRDYYLLRGPLASYADFPDGPSYWWPEDRAWCWSSDIDFAWGYLGGSAACLDEVLAVPVIDALPTTPDNPAMSGMDTINDPDGTIPRSP